MKDFGQWFKEQRPLKDDTTNDETHVRLKCTGCGKSELVELNALENGDAWATFNVDTGEGQCGGSDRCVP